MNLDLIKQLSTLLSVDTSVQQLAVRHILAIYCCYLGNTLVCYLGNTKQGVA